MTLNLGKTKFTLQKKGFAFLGIVPLLMATAWIPVTCPACHGTGHMSSYGMEHVTIIEKPYVIESVSTRDVCDSYLKYYMKIIIMLQNDGDQDATGYLVLQILDPSSNYTFDIQHVAARVGAGMTAPNEAEVIFNMPLDASKNKLPTVLASVPDDRHACSECNGTGKVVLNSWALSKKKWELHSSTNVLWELRTDPISLDEFEGGIHVPVLDEYGHPVFDADGFVVMEYIMDDGGVWIQAVDDNGIPILDSQGRTIDIYVYN